VPLRIAELYRNNARAKTQEQSDKETVDVGSGSFGSDMRGVRGIADGSDGGTTIRQAKGRRKKEVRRQGSFMPAIRESAEANICLKPSSALERRYGNRRTRLNEQYDISKKISSAASEAQKCKKPAEASFQFTTINSSIDPYYLNGAADFQDLKKTHAICMVLLCPLTELPAYWHVFFRHFVINEWLEYSTEKPVDRPASPLFYICYSAICRFSVKIE
jgi:hypothetical protein